MKSNKRLFIEKYCVAIKGDGNYGHIVGDPVYDDLENLLLEAIEKDGWISVADQLPESSQDDILFFTEFVYMGTYENGSFYFDTGFDANKVTHWQPLPKPPKT